MNDAEHGERLLDLVRRGLSPSSNDTERVRASLEMVLSSGAAAINSGSVTEPGNWLIGWAAKGVALLAVAAGAGAMGFWAGRRSALDERSMTPPAMLAAVPSATGAPGPEPAADPEPAVAAESQPRAPRGGTFIAPEPVADPSEEVRTLRRVERALRSGNPQLALALLEELDRKVGKGNLSEERRAAYVVASCEQTFGPSRESLLAGFLERYPQSVYAARVRASCSTPKPQSEATDAGGSDSAGREK